MLTEPSSEVGLFELSTRQRQDRGDDFFLGGVNAEAIQAEEEIHGLEGDPFVPVHEGVVVSQTEAIRSSKSGKIGVRVVVEPVARSFEG